MGRFINADGYASTGQSFAGNNNSVNMHDSEGSRAVENGTRGSFTFVNPSGSVVDYNYNERETVITYKSDSLPYTGQPNSKDTLYNPDGTPKQDRWRGPDGKPVRDRDYNHAGDVPFPHDHDWPNGKRNTDHLPPDPTYKIRWDPILGGELVFVCAVGMVLVAADDATGVGIPDDFLFGPLAVGVREGLIMVFG